MKSMIDRWLADRDFVTREEFDAVRAMAQKAREENEALKAAPGRAGGGAEVSAPPVRNGPLQRKAAAGLFVPWYFRCSGSARRIGGLLLSNLP